MSCPAFHRQVAERQGTQTLPKNRGPKTRGQSGVARLSQTLEDGGNPRGVDHACAGIAAAHSGITRQPFRHSARPRRNLFRAFLEGVSSPCAMTWRVRGIDATSFRNHRQAFRNLVWTRVNHTRGLPKSHRRPSAWGLVVLPNHCEPFRRTINTFCNQLAHIPG